MICRGHVDMDVSIVIPESTRGDSCTPVIHFEFLDGQELLGDVAHAYITGAHAIQSPRFDTPAYICRGVQN